MKTKKNLKQLLFIAIFLPVSLPLFSQEDVVKASITASVFYETFDGCCDIGGNDTYWGTDSRYASLVTDNESLDLGTNNAKYTAAQCLKIGKADKTHIVIKCPKISFNGSGGFFRFRAGGVNSSNKATNVYYGTSGSITSQYFSFTEGKFTEFQGNIDSKDNVTLAISNGPSSGANKGSYVFIDDIIIYKYSATAEEQQKAAKIILSGLFSSTEVEELNRNLALNNTITNIDAGDASFPSNTTLTPGNKNCLIFAVG